MGKPQGQIVNRSHSGGRSVAHCWVMLFEQNERNAQLQNWVSVLTDTDLADTMASLFPDRNFSKNMRAANRVRGAYNRGTLQKGKGKPRRRSWRYHREGGKVVRIPRFGRIPSSS